MKPQAKWTVQAQAGMEGGQTDGAEEDGNRELKLKTHFLSSVSLDQLHPIQN